MTYKILLTFICLLSPWISFSQSTIQIESAGSSIHLAVWSAGVKPIATVLILPGWGGGPNDVFHIGETLSSQQITTIVLSARGWHMSEGRATFFNALEDIESAVEWIRDSGRKDIDSNHIVLGGHSWGGGMALAYGAKDTSIHRMFSIAGTDHGIFIRKYLSDQQFAGMVNRILASTAAPNGPILFDVEETLTELKESQDVFGLLENAENLKGRSILIFGGWEDVNTTIDDFLLPNYRAFKKAGVSDIVFKTYHENHGFGSVRPLIQNDLVSWIRGKEKYAN